MDIEKVDPTIIVAAIGVMATIISGLIGRATRKAEAEEVEASAADKLAVGYTRLVDSWERRLAIVQADLLQMREESADDRREIKRLTLSESELKAELATMTERQAAMRDELELVKAERDAFMTENEALWQRVEELERLLGVYLDGGSG